MRLPAKGGETGFGLIDRFWGTASLSLRKESTGSDALHLLPCPSREVSAAVQDLVFYTRMFQDEMKRDPTNVELFDMAQSNSEHRCAALRSAEQGN